MLSHIHIRDFAIIRELDLDLHHGMNALTGETGAGKSILVDAIGLVPGDRADSGVVRHGAERTDISLNVNLNQLEHIHHWLVEHDLDSGDDCMLRRVIRADGGSKAYINGSPTTVGLLRDLGELIVDIHGQHAHQSLMKKDQQRQLIDQFANITGDVNQLKKIYSEWRDLDQRIRRLDEEGDLRQARIDQLRFDIDELSKLDLSDNELNTLNDEHSRLSNASDLIQTCEMVAHGLYEAESNSLYDALSQHIHSIESQLRHDEQLREPLEQLQGAQIQIQESAEFIRRYQDHLELDPARLTWVEERLGAIHDIARKHRVGPEAVFPLLEQWQNELDQLDGEGMDIDSLKEKHNELELAYRELAASISSNRQQAAATLSQSVTESMQELGMEGGRFTINVSYTAEAKPSPSGLDSVEMLVAANPGQPENPLTKVASGGELSRISLAIQMAAIEAVTIPCLIFDEVDSGIGGGVAETVGKQLRELGEQHQVLCVTHLPQVAAQAHHHFQVSKSKQADHTDTGIAYLSDAQRVDEIARMLGGQEITEKTREHADEMIQRASA